MINTRFLHSPGSCYGSRSIYQKKALSDSSTSGLNERWAEENRNWSWWSLYCPKHTTHKGYSFPFTDDEIKQNKTTQTIARQTLSVGISAHLETKCNDGPVSKVYFSYDVWGHFADLKITTNWKMIATQPLQWNKPRNFQVTLSSSAQRSLS